MYGECITCTVRERSGRDDITVQLDTSPLVPHTKVRSSDPWTSWAAARSLPLDLRDTQAAVLAALIERGPSTLEQLCDRYDELHATDSERWPRQSVSGVRTRCAELCDVGLVEDTGRTELTRAGRPARVLRVVSRS